MAKQKEVAIIKLDDIKLESVVNSSGLELEKALNHAFQFVPSMKEINELTTVLATMNKDNPSDEDVKLARANRLKLVKVRSGAKQKKEELKDSILTEGKLIDKLYNTVIDTAGLSEEEFEAIEKHYENLEKQKKEALQKSRADLLREYADPDPFPLGEMTEENFNNLLEGMKLQKEKKEEEARKAEEERIAKEREEELERQRIKEENERLLKEKEEKDKIRSKRNTELRPYIVFIHDYNAMLDMTEEAYQKELADIKEGAELEWEADRKKKAKKDQEEAEKEKSLQEEREQAKKDKEAREKLESEAKTKREAEEKAEKERIAAEKKAAKAPDKTKLKNFVAAFEIPQQASGLSQESLVVESLIIEKFNAFKKWAETQIENI